MNKEVDCNWISQSRRDENAKINILCFPYAGGGASIFKHWQQYLPEEMSILAVKLPGRERKIREAPFSKWSNLIDTMIEILLPHLDIPFVFFGHSFGARIAYELTKTLQKNNASMPKLLIISACRAPHIPTKMPYLYSLPKEKFIESLKMMNGTPSDLLQNNKVFEMIENTIRSDMKLAELWQDDPIKLNTPISIFSGKNDMIDPLSRMQEWDKYTNKKFDSHQFSGDHFFLHSNESMVVQTALKLIRNINYDN